MRPTEILVSEANLYYQLTYQLDPGASPPRTPLAFARGAPNAPLRSGGRARGAPPLCGNEYRILVRCPHNGVMTNWTPRPMGSACKLVSGLEPATRLELVTC
jgi:hypothetical protein